MSSYYLPSMREHGRPYRKDVNEEGVEEEEGAEAEEG